MAIGRFGHSGVQVGVQWAAEGFRLSSRNWGDIIIFRACYAPEPAVFMGDLLARPVYVLNLGWCQQTGDGIVFQGGSNFSLCIDKSLRLSTAALSVESLLFA